MNRLTDRKIILITRKTRLENLIVRYNTIQQAQFIIEHSGNDFSDYLEENCQYKNVLTQIVSVLERLGNIHVLDREFVPNYIFGKEDIVIAVGQDGLVANTLKYLMVSTPILVVGTGFCYRLVLQILRRSSLMYYTISEDARKSHWHRLT